MGILDALTGAAGEDAAEENAKRAEEFRRDANILYNGALTNSLGSINYAKTHLDPLQNLANKYAGGTNMYMNSLGLNGAAGTQAAVNAFQTGPGYEFTKNQQLDSLDRRAASRGLLGSGNTSLDTLAVVNGLANQEYGGWQNRLQGFMAPELSAQGAYSTGLAGLESSKANVYNNDAARRVGAYQYTSQAQSDAATQRANAQTAASGNMINLGMNLASMAAGGMGGGSGGIGSFLGGGGGNTGGLAGNGNLLPSASFLDHGMSW